VFVRINISNFANKKFKTPINLMWLLQYSCLTFMAKSINTRSVMNLGPFSRLRVSCIMIALSLYCTRLFSLPERSEGASFEILYRDWAWRPMCVHHLILLLYNWSLRAGNWHAYFPHIWLQSYQPDFWYFPLEAELFKLKVLYLRLSLLLYF